MIDIPFLRRGEKAGPEKGKEEPEEPPAKHKCRAALYKHIIERYREQIEAGESKTIPELRGLVNPNDKTVAAIADHMRGSFHPYVYEEKFLLAARKAFEFVRDDIELESLPVDFWLYPEDIVELGVADAVDKAMLLCSLLIALENESARVVVETDGTRRAFVTFDFKGSFHILDPVQDIFESGVKEDLIRKHVQGDNYKLVYEFNNKEYEEW
ncbi:MAG: hypothetical protein NT157_05450 [Candidatus Micrarchaeota archaeon]|nr:hypothetical protein [Candidatus Micrarchaeota archaeon]